MTPMPNIPPSLNFKEACALVALHNVLGSYTMSLGNGEWIAEQAWMIADQMEHKKR